MKKTAIQIAVLAALLLAVCVGSRLARHNAYTARIPLSGDREAAAVGEVRVSVGTPGVLTPSEPRLRDGWLEVSVRPQGRGEALIDLDDASGGDLAEVRLKVDPFGTVYDPSTGGFTGDAVALAAFTAFCLTVAAIMLHAFLQARGPGFYAYTTVYAAGFALFALLTGLMMLEVTLRHLLRPRDFTMLSAYGAITSASWRFMMVTAPLLGAFALALAVSNVALLRHEPFHPRNALAIGVSVLLVAGEALGYALYRQSYAGWRRAYLRDALRNVYATGYAYFECMLIGAAVCGLKAARHVPQGEADYILILGCRFRRDGTLTPLLRGRVDRALEFWRRQRDATGREAVLMPSGGRGPDECMSEAEAMGRYLLEQGVPPERIALEDRSRNTYQNMLYSGELIRRANPGAKVVYATTNYHVFRCGVWASRAGLHAEGMGSDTQWWYWPNAFMRECAGLFVHRLGQELALLAALVGLFAALSVALAG